jgi:hypothetical protein
MEEWVILRNYEFRNSGIANYEKFLNPIIPQFLNFTQHSNIPFIHCSMIPVGLSFVLQIGVRRRKIENCGADHGHWRWIGRM